MGLSAGRCRGKTLLERLRLRYLLNGVGRIDELTDGGGELEHEADHIPGREP